MLSVICAARYLMELVNQHFSLFWCSYGANAFFCRSKHENHVEFSFISPVLITEKKVMPEKLNE